MPRRKLIKSRKASVSTMPASMPACTTDVRGSSANGTPLGASPADTTWPPRVMAPDRNCRACDSLCSFSICCSRNRACCARLARSWRDVRPSSMPTPPPPMPKAMELSGEKPRALASEMSRPNPSRKLLKSARASLLLKRSANPLAMSLPRKYRC